MNYRAFLAVSFLLNGLLMIGMKAVGEMHLAAYIAVILLIQYAMSALFASPSMIAPKRKPTRAGIIVGALAGISSAVGMFSNTAAADRLPGYVTFPVIQGGTLVLVVIVGLISFREKVGLYGIAGILASVAAIVLLSG